MRAITVPDPSEIEIGLYRLCEEEFGHRPRPWRDAVQEYYGK
jgi:hypothetical protein